jgi:putative ABC transport system permease protein
VSFILQMARREVRSSWKRLFFFFLCIGIGVASIVALRSTIQNANQAVAGEARLFLTADVQVDSARPWTPESLAPINALAQPPLVQGRAETIEANTMIRPADPGHEGAMMVELKGIESPFPLYGDFQLSDGRPFDYALLANNGAVVAPLVLERLGLAVGSEVKIGSSTFQIRGTVTHEPGGGGGGFRMGPRVFIERSAVEATGLTAFGSRARRKIFFKTAPGQMERFAEELRADLKNSLITVRSYKDSQENLNEQFTRAENYLSLTGLVILVLGGIGVSSVTRVFIEQKRKTIAVLKCLGATGPRITATYLVQVIALGLAGSLLGVGLAKVSLVAARHFFSESLPSNMSYQLTRSSVATGIGLGLLISVLFSALPLLRIRHIKPDMLLREASRGASGRRFDWLRWVAGGLVALAMVLMAAWQAGSIRVGLFFIGGLAATSGALYLAAWALILLVRRARSLGPFPVRQAISGLHRPGNQTRVTVMAVGLGVFLVLAIQSLQANLLNEFDHLRGGNLPNMFLIDIQKDQAPGVAQIVEQNTGKRPVLIPTVRARIVAIDGREIDLDKGEMKADRGRLGREYVLTYRPQLEANETIIEGKFWDPIPSSEPEVSIEESMRGLSGLKLGGSITFDILGRRMTARVTSVRHVDWRNSRTGFLLLFRPGTLESAPQTFVGAVDGPLAEPERSRFQRTLLDRFPNVSVIDVADILRSVNRILNNITLAVSFIGGFIFFSGGLILVGSIAMTKFQRIYEAAVLRTLGAKQKMLWTILITEYGLLGLVAGIVGSLAAGALSYAVSRFVLEIDWSFTPGINLIGIAATILLVVGVGALSSYDVLRGKPLSILRSQ